MSNAPKIDLPSENITPVQRDLIHRIVSLVDKFRELYRQESEIDCQVEEQDSQKVIRRANRIRKFGEKLESLAGKKWFSKRD